MKKILFTMLFVLLFAGVASAANITFAWDASTGAPDGYNFYQGPAGGPWVKLNTAAVTNTTYVVNAFSEAGGTCFTVEAYKGAYTTPKSTQVCLPSTPANLRITIIN